jgi:hypothetical protein
MSNNSREDKTSSKGKYWSFRVVQTWHIKWTVDRSSSYTEGAWPYPMLSHPWLDWNTGTYNNDRIDAAADGTAAGIYATIAEAAREHKVSPYM